MQYSSKVIEEAVEQLASLPSIGRPSALRLVLSMLKRRPEEMERFAQAFLDLNSKIKYCKECHNISDEDTCSICNNPRRDKSLVCVVEDIRDVMAIENTRQFNGVYHVLGGIISPMEGIGPSDITIDSLVEKVNKGTVKEIILALSTTMEGDTTGFFIFRKLKEKTISISNIARGISVGDELEYADEVTLGRSILNRVPYDNSYGVAK
ncbi:MAG TPA: recombination protein RecR [Flavobacteriales bacterium]|nr:recombination protein RecR [Flavobacteriales bacterium]